MLDSLTPSGTVRVKMADGRVVSQPRVLVDLPICFSDFDSVESFFVIDLDDRWDLILGMPWFESAEPIVDWRSKTVCKPPTP